MLTIEYGTDSICHSFIGTLKRNQLHGGLREKNVQVTFYSSYGCMHIEFDIYF